MTRYDSGDPARPIRIPPFAALKAAVRTSIERSIPIPTLIRSRVRWWEVTGGGPPSRAVYAACFRNLLRERPCGISPQRAALLSYAVWRLAGRTYAPIFGRSRRWLVENLQPSGLEHLEATRRAGTGCVLVGAHVGLFAWAGPALWGMGYPIMQTGRLHTSLDFAYLMSRDGLMARRLPHGRVGRGAVQLKKLHELLSGGAWLRHTGDAPDPEQGLRGRIFGRPVRLVRAPWVLSQLTGAPVVPVVMPVEDDLRPRFRVGPPIFVERNAHGRAACEDAMQRYLDFLADAAGHVAWNFHPRPWAHWFSDAPG